MLPWLPWSLAPLCITGEIEFNAFILLDRGKNSNRKILHQPENCFNKNPNRNIVFETNSQFFYSMPFYILSYQPRPGKRTNIWQVLLDSGFKINFPSCLLRGCGYVLWFRTFPTTCPFHKNPQIHLKKRPGSLSRVKPIDMLGPWFVGTCPRIPKTWTEGFSDYQLYTGTQP